VRTILAKVLVWSLGTFVLSLVAFWAISRTLERRGPPRGDPFSGLMTMVEEDARRAYEEGGSEGLTAYLKRIDARLPGQHYLTDARGRDLACGSDRSDLLRRGQAPPEPLRRVGDRFIMIARPCDPRYRFISVVKPWFQPPTILPYYGAIVVVIGLMGSVLAGHLAAPLRRLRLVVDRFGRGDLTARMDSARRDEIGELSRAFDEMADRIETLLSAERRLLQDVSHELRSPLTRLDVAVDLALTSPDRDALLGRIKRDIGRLSVLVNELLQLTRAEGDPSEREQEEIRLDDLLHDLADECAIEAQANGSGLVLRKASSCSIRGERELLRRAVENIIRNAIRHEPEGSAVEIALETGADSVIIVVRDHGPGVPEELLDAIFEPFFRVEGHRSRASGGVGLGLAIARRAVNLHGGTISARNAGPGLAVAITLPREITKRAVL
jgi:two-component system sensor histidine kinase CpxA